MLLHLQICGYSRFLKFQRSFYHTSGSAVLQDQVGILNGEKLAKQLMIDFEVTSLIWVSGLYFHYIFNAVGYLS